MSPFVDEENNGNEEHPSEPPESPPDVIIIKEGEPPPANPELIIKMLVPGIDIIKKTKDGHKDEGNDKDKDKK